MRKSFVSALSLLCVLCLGGAAWAADFAVVDVDKIFAESAPAKAGAQHMEQVRKVLQEGMEDLKKLYKGKEETPEAQRALVQGQMVLERQMALELQAVNSIVHEELVDVVKAWRRRNRKTLMVLNSKMLLDSDGSVDITTAVMREMNKRKPKFPDLPKVNVNNPKPEPRPSSRRK